jgi:hypothetical protein
VSAANDFTFPLPVKSLTVEPFSRELTNNDCIYTNILNNTNEVKQTFNSTIFGFQPIIGLILALSLIILSIGIIVSLLYRIPGIFAFLSIFASFGLTLMILVLSKYTLSIAMFIGLLIGILGSTISSFS